MPQVMPAEGAASPRSTSQKTFRVDITIIQRYAQDRNNISIIMTTTSIEVDHLFTFTSDLVAPIFVENGPQGSRAIIGVLNGTFEGPKLRGTVLSQGGEWATLRPDGSGKIDVRLTLKTEDGAIILMSYNGIFCPQADGNVSIRTAPLFETGDPRYAWLNSILSV